MYYATPSINMMDEKQPKYEIIVHLLDEQRLKFSQIFLVSKKKKVKFFTNREWNTLIYLNVKLDLDDCVGFLLHLYNLPILK